MSKSYIKLKNVGDAATFTVVRCAPGTGRYPDIEFEDDRGNIYPVPKSAADRQLDRLGLTDDSIIGSVITISRSENKQDPSKNYWNIEWAKGNGSGPASAGKAGASTSGGAVASSLPPQPPAPSPKDQGASGYKLYRQITEKVLADIVPLYAEHGVTPDAQTVAAISATIYIQASRNA